MTDRDEEEVLDKIDRLTAPVFSMSTSDGNPFRKENEELSRKVELINRRNEILSRDPDYFKKRRKKMDQVSERKENERFEKRMWEREKWKREQEKFGQMTALSLLAAVFVFLLLPAIVWGITYYWFQVRKTTPAPPVR